MPKKWYTLVCTKCQGRGHTAGYCWAEVTTEPPPLTIAGASSSASESSAPPIPPRPSMPMSNWTPSGDKAWDEVDPERLLSLPRWGKTPVIKATVSPKRPRRPKKETKTEAQVTDPNSVVDSDHLLEQNGANAVMTKHSTPGAPSQIRPARNPTVERALAHAEQCNCSE